jgi:hypothetical protein
MDLFADHTVFVVNEEMTKTIARRVSANISTTFTSAYQMVSDQARLLKKGKGR